MTKPNLNPFAANLNPFYVPDEVLETFKEAHPLAKRLIEFKLSKSFLRGKYSPTEMKKSGISEFRKISGLGSYSPKQVSMRRVIGKTEFLLNFRRHPMCWSDTRFPRFLGPYGQIILAGSHGIALDETTKEYNIFLVGPTQNFWHNPEEIEMALYLFYKLGIVKPGSVKFRTNHAETPHLRYDDCFFTLSEEFTKAFGKELYRTYCLSAPLFVKPSEDLRSPLAGA